MTARKISVANRTNTETGKVAAVLVSIFGLLLLSACQPAAIVWLSVPDELDGGEVWIDGEPRTTIQDRVAMFDMAIGQHEIVVKKQGFRDVKMVVNHDEELYLSVPNDQIVPLSPSK